MIALTQAAAQQAEAAADALGGMPPHVADRLPGAMLHTMARAAAQEAEWAAQALGAMPLHGAKRLTDADLHARTQAAAQEAEWAAQALGAMPLHGAKRLTDADLHALTQTAAQEAEWAAHACGAMPPHVVERMPDDDVRTLVQAASQTSHAGEAALTLIEFPDVGLPDIVASMAAQEAWSAALALGGMPPQVVARLPDDALHALTRAAAQKDGWAAQALRSLTATLRQDDPTAQARAARLAVARLRRHRRFAVSGRPDRLGAARAAGGAGAWRCARRTAGAGAARRRRRAAARDSGGAAHSARCAAAPVAAVRWAATGAG